MRADDHRLAEIRRLQNVVPATARQCPAHEDDIGALKQRREFADGIEQQHSRKIERRGKRRPARETYARSLEFLSHHVEPLGPAWGQNQQQTAPPGHKHFERLQHCVVLVDIARQERRHCAGGDPNALRVHAIQKLHDIRSRSRRGRLEIVFQIAFHRHKTRPRARHYESSPVFLRLRQNRVRPAQHVAEKPSPGSITRQRLVGNPSVHHQQRSARAFRLAIEVRPDFRLEHHDQRGPQAPKDPPDHGSVIDGCEKYAIGQAGQLLIGCRASGKRCR